MTPYDQAKALFEEYLQTQAWQASLNQGPELVESMRYSLLQNGKRFRPVLCLLLCEQFGVPPQKALPFTAAVEMMHTYSLIHDDLPCMDDDDLRRGLPTNHIEFGEPIALLAGDALQAEAFALIAEAYAKEPALGLRLVLLLSKATGVHGMVGGQALDIMNSEPKNLIQTQQMHAMKTGALIRCACEGAAVVMGMPSEKQNLFRNFGESLGLAFQIADDLLDSSDGEIEEGSYPALLGLEGSRGALLEATTQSENILKTLGVTSGPLLDLVKYNAKRDF